MANIKIENISGSDLFNDTESFMQELTEDEFLSTNGGISPTTVWVVVAAAILFKQTMNA
jgi:hypothetical protein